MTIRPIQNFRGVRASIVAPDDANRTVLAEVLERLGLAVEQGETWPVPAGSAQLLFVDADALGAAAETDLARPRPTVVAIIGHETPSRLQRAYELEPASFLMKPIRRSGVFAAVYFAVNEQRRRREVLDRLRTAEARLGARRFVVKAILHLIEVGQLSEEEAFQRLRQESMRQRLTVEELSLRMVAELGSRLRRMGASRS